MASDSWWEKARNSELVKQQESATAMYCVACGSTCSPDWVYCRSCGERQRSVFESQVTEQLDDSDLAAPAVDSPRPRLSEKPITCTRCGVVNTLGTARCDCGDSLRSASPPRSASSSGPLAEAEKAKKLRLEGLRDEIRKLETSPRRPQSQGPLDKSFLQLSPPTEIDLQTYVPLLGRWFGGKPTVRHDDAAWECHRRETNRTKLELVPMFYKLLERCCGEGEPLIRSLQREVVEREILLARIVAGSHSMLRLFDADTVLRILLHVRLAVKAYSSSRFGFDAHLAAAEADRFLDELRLLCGVPPDANPLDGYGSLAAKLVKKIVGAHLPVVAIELAGERVIRPDLIMAIVHILLTHNDYWARVSNKYRV
jgi:hypothetical protein